MHTIDQAHNKHQVINSIGIFYSDIFPYFML